MIELFGFELGTVFQGGTLILLAIVAVRTSPQWLVTWAAARTERSNANAKRIAKLEATIEQQRTDFDIAIQKCRDDCDRETSDLRETIKGMERQQFARQRAVIRAILSTVTDPQLKQQLELLESVQVLDSGVQVLPPDPDTPELRSAKDTVAENETALASNKTALASAKKTCKEIERKEGDGK